MRHMLRNSLVTGLLISLPALSMAAAPAASTAKKQAPAAGATAAAARPAAVPVPPPSKPSTKAGSKAEVAGHSTSGVVKSVTDSRLVITRKSQNKPVAMTFRLDPSTEREGKLQAGSNVSVRYRNEGRTHVATAVKLEAGKKGNS